MLRGAPKHIHTTEQALSPGDEGTRRWRKMDVHQIGADWWLQEMQLRKGIKHNNPAEAAAQHLHCCVQFMLRWEAPVAAGSSNKKERSISKLGMTSTAFLEDVSFSWGVWRRQFSRPCHPLGQTSEELWHPALSPSGTSCQSLHGDTAGDFTLHLKEIHPVQLGKSRKY